MPIDYASYGLDPATALPAAQEQSYIEAASAALTAEAARDACNDDEDREIYAERAAAARERADTIRRANRMTKSEARDAQRVLIDNNLRALAQQHLTLEARVQTGQGSEELTQEQTSIEARMAALEALKSNLA